MLRDSQNGGNSEDLLTLAEDIEERDLHYYSLLQTRKMAVYGSTLRVDPREETDEALATEVYDKLVNKPAFRHMLQDLLDALGKGFSVVQLLWNPAAALGQKGRWALGFQHEDARLFRFDRETQRELRIRDATNDDGIPLPPGQFAVHFPRLRTGVPIRGGLARLAAVTWMFKNFTIKDWVAFAEVYGMPLRLATYDPHVMTADEISSLRSTLANMGHDAAGLVPSGVEVEIHDVNRGSNGGPFQPLAEYFDKQLSKGILGQTMTIEDGSSLSQSETHEKVRQDIRQADALNLQDTVQAAIIEPWVALNYGPDKVERVQFVIETDPPEDLKAFTEAVLPWVEKAKLPVSLRQLREKFNLQEPEGDEDTLAATDPIELASAQAEAKAKFAPAPAKTKPAPNAQQPAALPETIQITEDLASSLSEEWEDLLGPHRRTLLAAANGADSYEGFLKALDKATEQMDSNEFVRKLAIAGLQARGIGAGRPL